jgi:hypothetical protein
MQVARINANGFEQIADALGQHHKLGRDHFTSAMLNAWATDAENHFSDGNGCFFEIRRFDTNSGSPVEVTISAEGYDVEEVNDE